MELTLGGWSLVCCRPASISMLLNQGHSKAFLVVTLGVSSDERPETLVHILRCTAPDDKESFVSTSLLLLRNPVVTEYFQDTPLTNALAPRRCKTALSIIKVFLTFGGDLSPSSFTHSLSVCYLEHQIVHLSSVI